MNNEEARFILSAYRPDGEDAGDARFVEALSQAERDPDLAAWFQDARRFDHTMSEALGALPIPPDLRGRILAGSKVSRPRWERRPRTILALAAGIVLLAALGLIWLQRAPSLERWQRDALAFVDVLERGEVGFDLENKNVAVLQEWLRAHDAPAPAALPATLRALPSLGCKTINVGGRAISIICFRMETGELIHLAVTDQVSPARERTAALRFGEGAGWRTASWSASGRDYLLATKAPARELRAVVAGFRTASRVRPAEPRVALELISR